MARAPQLVRWAHGWSNVPECSPAPRYVQRIGTSVELHGAADDRPGGGGQKYAVR
jgi:hypothetical protein